MWEEVPVVQGLRGVEDLVGASGCHLPLSHRCESSVTAFRTVSGHTVDPGEPRSCRPSCIEARFVQPFPTPRCSQANMDKKDDVNRYALLDYDFATFSPGMRVVDIGCGKGRQLRKLAAHGCLAT